MGSLGRRGSRGVRRGREWGGGVAGRRGEWRRGGVGGAWVLGGVVGGWGVGGWVLGGAGAGWLVAALGGWRLPEWMAVVIFWGVLGMLLVRTALVGYFLQTLARRIPNDELWN